MTEDSDEDVRRKIEQRFARVLNNPCIVLEVELDGVPMGAPHKEWHDKAFQRIDELRSNGLSINEACRQVAADISRRNNIEPRTVEMAYRRHQREFWCYEFSKCIIMKDIEGAVEAYRHLTKHNKRKLGLK